MNKKIVVKFRGGKVYVVGDADKHHINCAYNALRVGDIQPTKRTKLRRTLKRLCRSLQYACKSDINRRQNNQYKYLASKKEKAAAGQQP